MTKKFKYETTPEEIYGKNWESQIPDGYEAVAFRPPSNAFEENYILTHNGDDIDIPEGPRIILRKKKVEKIVFTYVKTGVPKKDEWYQSRDKNAIVVSTMDSIVSEPRKIYTRTVIEE